ncbi:MAG: hypothetical protein CML68_13585 [Rhodobacteraceae bacterium]|nr:hypothetical protein [Paracoccaceae bacterium]
MFGPGVFDIAKGQWKAILMTAGVPEKSFAKSGGPCPLCGGTDRWAFKPGVNPNGVNRCRQCGGGEGRTGMQLFMAMTGKEFGEAAREVEEICGKAPPVRVQDTRREDGDAQRQRDAKNSLWRSSRRVVLGDPVDAYLKVRGVDQNGYSPDLRFHPSAWYAPRRYLPAMLAMVRDASGKPVTIHRTFLSNGYRIDAQDCRKPMPGQIPEGSAIRLSDVGPSLGIAEGIETAFAASDRFGLPVWSAMNAGRLGTWTPPEGVEEVAIFPDHDTNGVGQSAAERLADRLKSSGLTVSVHLPPRVDTDWADYARNEQ